MRGFLEHPRLLHLLLFVAFLINLPIGIFGLWSLGNIKESIASNNVVASMVTSEEDEEFIKKVCEDLGLENEITMIVGPYYIHSFFSQSQNYQLERLLSKHPIIVDPLDPTRRILMRESLYTEISKDERKAVIAHELWHIDSRSKGRYVSDVNLEMEADRFAVRYIHPDVLIRLLRKYGNDSASIHIRIQNLERQKLSIRGGSQ